MHIGNKVLEVKDKTQNNNKGSGLTSKHIYC